MFMFMPSAPDSSSCRGGLTVMICFHQNFLEVALSNVSCCVGKGAVGLCLCRRAPALRAEAGPDGHQGLGASAGGGGPAALRECS